jgi:hypothetical protein
MSEEAKPTLSSGGSGGHVGGKGALEGTGASGVQLWACHLLWWEPGPQAAAARIAGSLGQEVGSVHHLRGADRLRGADHLHL